MVYNAMRLSFLSYTEVDSCTDFNGSVYGFVWRPFKSITDLGKEEDGQFVIACEDLDNYDKNRKARKNPVTLIDDESVLVLQFAMICGTVGTVIAIQEDEGWWYIKCRACRGKDESGTMSLSLFNDEVQAMVGRSAYQLCEKYAKDLESQTDKNTTPNEKQNTNKRPAEGEPGSECSTRKKNVFEIKVEKDA
nr:replication protein A 70 kDa DNA-binding subunit B [Tanacetum cinerariifolium]